MIKHPRCRIALQYSARCLYLHLTITGWIVKLIHFFGGIADTAPVPKCELVLFFKEPAFSLIRQLLPENLLLRRFHK